MYRFRGETKERSQQIKHCGHVKTSETELAKYIFRFGPVLKIWHKLRNSKLSVRIQIFGILMGLQLRTENWGVRLRSVLWIIVFDKKNHTEIGVRRNQVRKLHELRTGIALENTIYKLKIVILLQLREKKKKQKHKQQTKQMQASPAQEVHLVYSRLPTTDAVHVLMCVFQRLK